MKDLRIARIASVLAALLLGGCASVTLTERGELDGMCVIGRRIPCGRYDRAVVIDNMSVDFLAWPILSGSMDWEAEKRNVAGHAVFGNQLTQEKFFDVLEKVAEREGCEIMHVEFNHVRDFPFGVTTDWTSCFKWFFPTQTMSCSAILRVKEKYL